MINLKISVNLLEKIFNKINIKNGKINPFELAMICKDWLKENEFNISSGFNSEISNGVNFCTIERYDISIERFIDPKKNEIELIIIACEWVLKNNLIKDKK